MIQQHISWYWRARRTGAGPEALLQQRARRVLTVNGTVPTGM